MSGGGGGSQKKTTDTGNGGDAQLQYRTIPAYQGNALGQIANQLSQGGYGTPNDMTAMLNSIHANMQIPYVQDSAGNPFYSGGLYMQAIRNYLKDQGVKTADTSGSVKETSKSGQPEGHY